MKIILITAICLLAACQTNSLPTTRNTILRQNTASMPMMSKGLIKSEFKFSADKTELTVIMTHDTGESVEAKTTRNPLTGNAIQTETTVRQNGVVTAKRVTSPSEAELAVKVSANNGWQDVYRELKSRYQLAGLIP